MTVRLRDICVYLPDRAGALAEFGEILGAAGVSLEGGGVFTHVGVGVAHFLYSDHDNNLVLVVDDDQLAATRAIAERWPAAANSL